MKRSPLKRKTPLRADPDKVRAWRLRTAKPLPKVGKKGKAWRKATPKIDAGFMAAGILSCEVRGPGCTGSHALQRAHTKKRRNLAKGELTRVVLACMTCHYAAEVLGESKMHAQLEAIVEARTESQKKALASHIGKPTV